MTTTITVNIAEYYVLASALIQSAHPGAPAALQLLDDAFSRYPDAGMAQFEMPTKCLGGTEVLDNDAFDCALRVATYKNDEFGTAEWAGPRVRAVLAGLRDIKRGLVIPCGMGW